MNTYRTAIGSLSDSEGKKADAIMIRRLDDDQPHMPFEEFGLSEHTLNYYNHLLKRVIQAEGIKRFYASGGRLAGQ